MVFYVRIETLGKFKMNSLTTQKYKKKTNTWREQRNPTEQPTISSRTNWILNSVEPTGRRWRTMRRYGKAIGHAHIDDGYAFERKRASLIDERYPLSSTTHARMDMRDAYRVHCRRSDPLTTGYWWKSNDEIWVSMFRIALREIESKFTFF